MLANPEPSSPYKHPVEHLYFIIKGPDTDVLFTKAFGAIYAAAHWFHHLTHDQKVRHVSENTVFITRGEFTLTIRGTNLEKLEEYEPTKAEKEFTPAYPDLSTLRRLRAFDTLSTPKVQEFTPPPAQSKPPTIAKRHKIQKPAPDGSTTVAQLCEELNIAPNKGRNILRKANVKKPDHGWTYKNTDPALKIIRDLLAKG